MNGEIVLNRVALDDSRRKVFEFGIWRNDNMMFVRNFKIKDRFINSCLETYSKGWSFSSINPANKYRTFFM